MVYKFEFNRSAFKHGITEEDIRWAFMHYRYDGPVEDMENKFIRIGFDALAIYWKLCIMNMRI